MAKSEGATLAAKYIAEVLADQKALGYSGVVAPTVRAEAEQHAEHALESLAASSKAREPIAA